MDKEIYLVIREYKQKLETMGIEIKKIFLYGSHSSGIGKEDSDLDLVVVSNDFKNMGLWERLCLLGRARMGIKKPMGILGLTQEEFAAEQIGTFIEDEVKSKGVEVT